MHLEGRVQLYGRPHRVWSKSTQHIEQLFSGFAHAADPLRMQQQSTEKWTILSICVQSLSPYWDIFCDFGPVLGTFSDICSRRVYKARDVDRTCAQEVKRGVSTMGGRPPKCGQNVSKMDRELDVGQEKHWMTLFFWRNSKRLESEAQLRKSEKNRKS